MSPLSDDPDAITRRVLVLARVFQLEALAQRTARTFQRALICTELTPAEVAAEMELILDRIVDEPAERADGRR